MKKIVSINFYGFWEGFNPKRFFIYKILSERYDVVIKENPDYAFISCFDYDYNFLNKCNGIRIYYTGENVSPDFSIFDYAIGFDDISFGDRYIRYPLSISDNHSVQLAQKKHLANLEFIKSKDLFCTFMYSHEGCKERREIFEEISKYKRVESVGKYLKNSSIDIPRDSENAAKISFQSRAKFVLAIENTSFPGYCTEKILHAFASRSIPIYYGDPTVATVFNHRSFVNCHDYPSFSDVLEQVKYIDENDTVYMDMMREKAFVTENYVQQKEMDLRKFLHNIFDQDISKAFRRQRDGIIIDRNDELKKLSFYKREYYVAQNRKMKNRLLRFIKKR